MKSRSRPPIEEDGSWGVKSPHVHLENEPLWPWMGLILLQPLCLARGLWLNRGVAGPGYFDEFRDAGFVQGILGGNLFGTPSPGTPGDGTPLIHFLAAGAASVSGAPPLIFWIKSRPWLILAVPANFFLMARGLLGGPAAILATAFLVLFNGALIPASMTATYAPWSFTPFFGFNRRGFSSSSRANRFARNYHDNCGMHNSWSSAPNVRLVGGGLLYRACGGRTLSYSRSSLLIA
jgi:hypothetical protein